MKEIKPTFFFEGKPTLVGIEREYKDTLQEQRYITRTLN
jgi:hypothetical protein